MNNTKFEFSVYDDTAIVVKYKGKSKKVVIPEEYNGFPVTSISEYCFYRSNIKSIVGKSITSIGNSAFKECTSLTTVDFPACLTIGSYAFKECSSLTTVDFPDCLTIGSYAFSWCSSLTNIEFPICTRVGYDAFIHCKKLVKKGKYKATNIDLTCRGFQYELGKWFEEERATLCEKGFHYVENFYDIFNYYWGELGKDFRIFLVEAKEISNESGEDSKRVCNKIKLVKEIKSYKDFF